MKEIAVNRRANFEYFIEDTFECGVVLVGSEVKETVEIPMELAVNETKEKIIRDFESGLDDGTVIKNITVSTALINENEACVKVIFECSEDIALFRQ